MKWSCNKRINVIAGRPLLASIAELSLKGRVLLLATPFFQRNGILGQIISTLSQVDIIAHVERINNPDILQLGKIASLYEKDVFEGIIAIGGGSNIDTAKVLSVMLAQNADVDILEKLKHEDIPLISDSLPIVAIPTTSGTGAECTQFATVWDMNNGYKYSLESEYLTPEYVILDPTLSLDLPQSLTLYTGLDALSHATESLWNRHYNPFARACAKEAISIITRELPIALAEPSNLTARTAMQNASYLAGLAISQTKTAIAHAISYPLTYQYDVPHGLACSFNIPALYDLLKEKGKLEQELVAYISRAAEFIRKLNLKEYLLKYIKPEELLGLLNEMNNPHRFSNFVLRVEKEDLLKVLHSSII